MIKNINNIDRIKLVITNLILLIYIVIILYFSDELFSYVWLLGGFPIFVIPILYTCMFVKSIELIRKNKKDFLNWFPLFILLIIIIIYIFFNPIWMKQIINYKKNYKERNDIINEIIQEKDNEYVKNISNKNSDISCDGKLYIHKNIESEILIEFCLSPAFPDGGCSLFYSSGNQELIKNNIISIDSIKKMDDNWYIVNFK